MSTISTTKMSAKQFMMLGVDPPGIRLEWVDGDVAINPAPLPEHSFTKTSIATLLGTYFEVNPLGEVLLGVGVRLHEFNIRRPVGRHPRRRCVSETGLV
jgi:Uma2 family endonuclease